VSEFLLYAVAFNLKKAAGDGGLNREESIKKGSGGPTRPRWRQKDVSTGREQDPR